MLRTIPQTRSWSLTARLAAMAVFVVLLFLSARVTIEIGPVPFTLQTLVVVLAGMVLGARDGAGSVASYVALIAAGLPLDARALGTAAFFGPTGGYLLGFIVAAFAAGWLVERAGARAWQRWLAGLVGMVIIYAFGFVLLKLNTGMTWEAAWAAGVAPFIVPDVAKAAVAAVMTEGMRALLRR